MGDHDLQTWLPLEWDDDAGEPYRFIASNDGTLGLYLENNSSKSKHHVETCQMCGRDICKLRTPVPPEYLASLSDGPDFTCDMLPSSVPKVKQIVWRDSFELDV